jgi:hypothetical protein
MWLVVSRKFMPMCTRLKTEIEMEQSKISAPMEFRKKVQEQVASV